MTEAVERIVNLALCFADATSPLTAERIRSEVAGYPAEQDDAAFNRMFERDKDELRRSGFVIVFDEERQSYSLDRRATFSSPVDLTGEEAAAVTAAGSALVDDPSFPFAADLRLALAKIAAELDTAGVPAAVRLADENPSQQATFVAALTDAAARGKRVTFGYTNSAGVSAPHELEPYGLFLHDGRWYLVGRDTGKDEVRTYTVSRMADVTVNASAPKTPDFNRPDDFEVGRFVRLPFQYGPGDAAFEAVLRFPANLAWRTRTLASGHGTLTEQSDGSIEWRIEARSPERLLRFVIENGPGIEVLAPTPLAEKLAASMAEVEALHA